VVRVFCLVSALLLGGLAPQPAFGAAPRFIVVSGASLGSPVLLEDHPENLLLLRSVVDAKVGVPLGELAGRPSLDLALFWGEGWTKGKLDPRRTDQHGRFYPATDNAPAVIQLPLADQPGPVEAPTVTRSILARHGVPVRVEPDSEGERVTALALLGASVGLIGLGLFMLSRRRLTRTLERGRCSPASWPLPR
jgi:hypothetical protein